jgi:hypothetical protein
MSTLTPHTAPSSRTSWGIALAAGSLLLIGGGTLVWSAHDPDAAARRGPPIADSGMPDRVAFAGELGVVRRELPLPPPPSGPGLHSIAFTVENGTRVVKIKVVETGDELVVDAATGRLLEARPSRPTAPPPLGKFAAPFEPMT